ncbi:MAG: D-alanyl-D-alanine carboxypeptidase family protein [Patescibacteria group bacterium]
MEPAQKNRALGVVLIAIILIGGFFFYRTYTKLSDARSELSSSTAAAEEFQFQLSEAGEENAELKESLENERARAEELSEKLSDATGAIDEFEKLSRIDPELLQKYSKVFFLNENYKPADLQDITTKYLYTPAKPATIHDEVWSNLRRLLARAERDKAPLKVVSGFRSFEDQTTLKGKYTTVYGSGANQFSADQGYSEHQLGTAVDFATVDTPPAELIFENTAGYKWLQKNAHNYGFVLSYPKGNSFYQFEPWHWRFVGVDLATDLYNDEKNFYEMDQREIDKYLIKIFD